MNTILLVEDTPDLADVIRRELQSAGHRVWHATDGRLALELYSEHQPDLVILDWMLPKLDGLEVLRRIRQHSMTPVLMLTARSDEIDRVIGLEVGADDYLSKPFGMRELLARVRAQLRRADAIRQTVQTDRSQTSDQLDYGSLQLDPLGHRVTLNDDELEVSPTEFALLQFLLRNPGRAFGRAYLLETIWGSTYLGGDRTVDNAMLRLRKKLGPLGDAIETVWGVGYRLKEL